MTDRPRRGVPYDADSDTDKALWKSLGQIDAGEPSPRLRQQFYHELERAMRPRWWQRLGTGLGFAGPSGWLTAAGCAAVGVLLGMLAGQEPAATDADRLTVLEQHVASLNKRLILDRIDNPSPSKRLLGVMDAAAQAEDDPELARALLTVASGDRVYAVRTAAIDALGPQLERTTVAQEIMAMLGTADSPHIQLALIDLLLRHGSAGQVERLVELAESGQLYPDLAAHVLDTARSEST